jgi:hypothetical protein
MIKRQVTSKNSSLLSNTSSAKHSAVAFDLSAHGRSGAMDGRRTLPEMAAPTKSFVEVLRLRPMTLVVAPGDDQATAWSRAPPPSFSPLDPIAEV